jgi:intraflagellar transport protein 20
MAGALAKAGLYIDELSKVRVLEPEVAHETSELKEQCRDFVESKYRTQIIFH